jgi:nitric oxide synthase oxygenase domain/subunit
MANFHAFYHKEVTCRGFCAGNWKWLITPMSASGNRCYLGLKKMTEYTLKPVGG